MRNVFKYIWLLGLTFVSGACSDENILPIEPDVPVVNGDTFNVTVSVAIPDMATASTRGILGETPGSGLKLTLLEFSKGIDSSNSYLTGIYQAETTSTTQVGNGGIVNFNVTLNLTSEPRRLHLMITDDFVSCNYGSEATILPTITVGDGTLSREAYWGKVDFDNGYATFDTAGNATLDTDLKTKLQDVPVIRNFAKVSLSENLTNFELYGFELVNVPTQGTIAPWNQKDLSVPELLNGTSMKPYSEINYQGIVPSNTNFDNQESVLKGWDEEDKDLEHPRYFSNASRYFYEHPFESTRHTYLIVQGVYTYTKPNETSPTRALGYYKLDLGKQENGTFLYYNLLRNINYSVTITSVSAPGAANITDAIDGVTFNNISADVKTTSMPSVSDGQNMLIVNTTSNVFVDNTTPFTLTYQYITDVAGTDRKVDNSKLKVQWLDKDRNVITDPKAGEVVASYSEDKTGDFYSITITPKNPTPANKMEYIRITDGQGLERIITLLLRNPWNFSDFLFQNGIQNAPTVSTSQNVSTSPGEQFTMYFRLPDGIPQEVFPLTFQIEADKQDIENNPIGTLSVNTGFSLFDQTKPAISYIKTVSYMEYSYKYDGDTGSTIKVDDSNKNTNHVIRCRFRTIVSGTGTTNVRIFNRYFNMGEASFTRQ